MLQVLCIEAHVERTSKDRAVVRTQKSIIRGVKEPLLYSIKYKNTQIKQT